MFPTASRGRCRAWIAPRCQDAEMARTAAYVTAL